MTDSTTPTAANNSKDTADTPAGWYGWVINHDHSWLFVISYLGLAVVLTLFISLFWLVVLVVIHGYLEWLRQQHELRQALGHAPRGLLWARALWEIKLDIALLLLALALTAYMQVLLGLAGVGQAARAGAQGGSRMLVWARMLRGLILTIDEGAQVARVGASKLSARKRGSSAEAAEASLLRPWQRWGIGDHLGIWISVLSILAIAIAPLITDMSMAAVLEEILDELRPFPAAGAELP